MALLDKLFATKRKLDDANRESRDRGRSSKLNPEQVRLLLFKECDWKGRKVLFDSSTINQVAAAKNDKPAAKATEAPCIVEVSEGFSYMYKGPAADANALGEMIFGAVAMNHKGVNLKIHIMDEPKRLMCTKVFFVPTRRISRTDRKAGSDQSVGPDRPTRPLSVPSRDEVALSFSFDRGDSGFCGEHSMHSSVSSTGDFFSMLDVWDGNSSQDDFYSFHSPPGRKLSASSTGSWQRRTSRSLATRFELGSRGLTSSDSQMYSGSSASSTTDSLSSATAVTARRSKLGLALLITVADDDMELIRRCVEHSPQLQALVCRLRIATMAAGGAGGAGATGGAVVGSTGGAGAGFVATMHKAACDAARWLTDLMYGPRLQPMWLGVVGDHRGSKVADGLVADICCVLSAGDTKHTNFFFSTLLTQVLTHHLGWVTTVSPYDVLDPQALPEDATKRPYNALWAQLNDLCGSIGFPPKAARTIISCTSNNNFVNRLLVVLTYFLRCGEVKRTDYRFRTCEVRETETLQVKTGLKRTVTKVSDLSLNVPEIRTPNSSDTLVFNDKRNLSLGSTLDANLDQPMTSQLRRNPTIGIALKSDSNSSISSSASDEIEERKVLFVLGDDEKLVGLKNKSVGGKSVKKSRQDDKVTKDSQIDKDKCITDSKILDSKATNDSANKNAAEEDNVACDVKINAEEATSDVGRNTEVEFKCVNEECPSEDIKCCSQTQHSKPIKHSGFKFDFDKYPQIVTNYMKSKNLEILDRHYIGKPGNLKLDNFQFDPTIVPPIQEERCEACYKCQMMESMLQTPTNASELEFMNDMPRITEPQFAKEIVVQPELPKEFLHVRKPNTIVVNVIKPDDDDAGVVKDCGVVTDCGEVKASGVVREIGVVKECGVVKKVMFPMLDVDKQCDDKSGFDESLLGGVTDHYVPDLVLQGTLAAPIVWEGELRRDLDLAAYLHRALDAPIQALAVVGDVNTWEVRVVPGGRGVGAGGGMSALVGAMLDALPQMRRARVPAHQCLSYLESKLREFCVLSKTLADMLMTTDFCDIETLTKSLNIDINDVPLLMAVATTHTPQVARRYGISYR